MYITLVAKFLGLQKKHLEILELELSISFYSVHFWMYDCITNHTYF